MEKGESQNGGRIGKEKENTNTKEKRRERSMRGQGRKMKQPRYLFRKDNCPIKMNSQAIQTMSLIITVTMAATAFVVLHELLRKKKIIKTTTSVRLKLESS